MSNKLLFWQNMVLWECFQLSLAHC